ncbi:ABC transporter substrate-binding protein [Lacrimispora sp. 210928-DFI.3.58]|uniref:ABC transporter substrate-binding protein n=1 Tax=Lacrimispora sp. 210928-DFI.3.58 TaxID=2883214 RepID=UPI0015B63289|nr:ABC transporter substrate-binding protein [Lacrimispora sp. 210928-DFI.3.58]MCB7318177.1 ABC transporter substrate-binding protein [Lacrimispora sp. 210928-DFI.3.58]
MKKVTALLLGICLVAAGISGCGGNGAARSTGGGKPQVEAEEQKAEGAQASETITVTDHTGVQVELPAQVNRVVVTDILPLPSILTVFLGSGEKIVGMSPASMSAAQSGLLGELFPDVLNASTDFISGSDVNMEELMKLEPDVVFFNAGSKELGESLRSAGFAAVGISVNKWEYNAIETYDQWIALLSEIFPEKGDTSERVSEYSRKVCEDIQKRVSSVSGEEKRDILFLFNYSDTTMITSGKRFFGQFWCDAVGGRNVAEEVAAENSNAVINMEQVYEWDPDVIFITNFTPAQPEDLYENAVGQDDWSSVKAVENREVYKLPLGTYRSYTPSTDTPMTLLWMAKNVYPSLFEDVDMTEEVKAYYKDMYGVELTDSQVERMYHPGREAAKGYKK